MSELRSNEPMLDMYIFETTQLVEQLEQLVLNSEKESGMLDSINEIFRIMHTIKGSSAMMLFNNISELSHAVEDLFYYLRENKPKNIDIEGLSDIIFDTVDFIKAEMSKIEQLKPADGNSSDRILNIRRFLENISGSGSSGVKTQDKGTEEENNSEKQVYFVTNTVGAEKDFKNYQAVIFFEEGCEMENIRAFGVVHRLSEIAELTYQIPENVMEDEESVKIIRESGFRMFFTSVLDYEAVRSVLEDTVFLRKLELNLISEKHPGYSEKNGYQNMTTEIMDSPDLRKEGVPEDRASVKSPQNQGFISINIEKTDRLMDLMGELVIAEAMVTQNPDLADLILDNFQKAASHLRKITSEIQDVVMSIRMVPLEATFHKMQRIVRDMSKKMDKDVNLRILGEDTEVDKNIIERISDPLMHLVRNAIDHGLETREERVKAGKATSGTVTLEARNSGSDVLIIVKDDGKGLDKDKILRKAKGNGLLKKPESEMTEREIFSLIFLPGFSTKENITEFSGRGVGMDVVTKNLEAVGGTAIIDSVAGGGTTITLKIPLTLAIIDGMNIRVGQARYTLPTIAIKESFRPAENDVFKDPEGNEMIMVRGNCYPVFRLHEYYKVSTGITDFAKGILIMVEQNEQSICIFADDLIGQQQVVVKALPDYIKKTKNISGLSGCTLLGDGNISLILDISGIINLMNPKVYGRSDD